MAVPGLHVPLPPKIPYGPVTALALSANDIKRQAQVRTQVRWDYSSAMKQNVVWQDLQTYGVVADQMTVECFTRLGYIGKPCPRPISAHDQASCTPLRICRVINTPQMR